MDVPAHKGTDATADVHADAGTDEISHVRCRNAVPNVRHTVPDPLPDGLHARAVGVTDAVPDDLTVAHCPPDWQVLPLRLGCHCV